MANPNGTIHTRMPFLKKQDPLTTSEKPYTVDFDISDIPSAKISNHTFDFHTIPIRDIRSAPSPFSLNTHGFTLLTHPSSLTAHNADNAAFIETTYFAELEALLYARFPEYARFEVLDHQVPSPFAHSAV